MKEARAHFSAASEHYRAGRFREALRGFELAERLVPSPELSFNIARAHEQLGEIDVAIEHYERYVAARGEASDVSSVQARIAALRASLQERPAQAVATAALRVDAEPGAEIKLDGTLLGVAPIERIVWIEPGTHVLEAELSGHAPYRAEIDAPAGSMVAGSVELVQRSSVPERGEPVRSRGASGAVCRAPDSSYAHVSGRRTSAGKRATRATEPRGSAIGIKRGRSSRPARGFLDELPWLLLARIPLGSCCRSSPCSRRA